MRVSISDFGCVSEWLLSVGGRAHW